MVKVDAMAVAKDGLVRFVPQTPWCAELLSDLVPDQVEEAEPDGRLAVPARFVNNLVRRLKACQVEVRGFETAPVAFCNLGGLHEW